MTERTGTIILGGGIAGLSLASMLDDRSIILEREAQTGGLCRSFPLNGIFYDIGPHILYSKNEQLLKRMLALIETVRIRRLSRIYHKGNLVKYPFENDLAALSPEDRDYCLKEFLSNPYESYDARTMLQFFLKTFGEGITRLYLQPYNEKIWKFDPAFMDTQMVERIPKPPAEDVIKSAQGVPTEGYLHQLYFNYPKRGGIQQLADAYRRLAEQKARIITSLGIRKISGKNGDWSIETDQGAFSAHTIVNCMPLHELFAVLDPEAGIPSAVRSALGGLKYNSIHIIAVQARADTLGENLSLNFAGNETLFHRFTKLNFLGEGYCLPDGASTFIAEITYRPGSYLAAQSPESIKERVVSDMERVGIIRREDVIAAELRSFPCAYVIYDLDHRRNTDIVLGYLRSVGIECCGRFAQFEYMNTDAVVEQSQKLAQKLNSLS
jgi:protoporphyrinogen oxidase